jgi:hypothetical protein
MFGVAPFGITLEGHEETETAPFPNDIAREPFVYHILNSTRHRLLPLLKNLKHMEAGLYLGPQSGWSKQDYNTMSQCGLAFATALILKTAPTAKETSLRLLGMPPLLYLMGELPGDLRRAGRFLIRNITARLEYFGHHLTHFDLGIDNTSLHAMPMMFPNQPGWPDQMTF